MPKDSRVTLKGQQRVHPSEFYDPRRPHHRINAKTVDAYEQVGVNER